MSDFSTKCGNVLLGGSTGAAAGGAIGAAIGSIGGPIGSAVAPSSAAVSAPCSLFSSTRQSMQLFFHPVWYTCLIIVRRWFHEFYRSSAAYCSRGSSRGLWPQAEVPSPCCLLVGNSTLFSFFQGGNFMQPFFMPLDDPFESLGGKRKPRFPFVCY